jgi:glycosyltransferase involved in cell wall biosynthesis
VMVGHGPEQAELRRLASELPSVELLGHVPFERLQRLYAQARVFCHPSLQENFGIAVVEALASGLGVVAHQQPAVMETVAGRPGAWVADTTSAEALSATLLEALDGPPSWDDARLCGLRARLDPALVGRQLRAIIESVR